jgi:hypoxanthine-DNA glycosylase
MPFGLSATTISAITATIAACPSVNNMVLFGSRAKGNYKPGSDIDIAVSGSNLTLHDFLDFSIRTDGLEIANKVDLIHYQTIKDPDLIEHITRVGIVLYENGIYRKYGLPPLIDENSKILILGSFPSDASLEKQQYYANARNQFWTVMTGICDEPDSKDYSDQIALMRKSRIALWDVIESCLRVGSSDSKIRYEIPNDIKRLINTHPNLTHILYNGNNPLRYFSKLRLHEGRLVPVPSLPSTSSAHARLSLEEKIDRWSAIRFIRGFGR